eukprot:TRINITY_DN2416_c0_g1_i2.p1 TRINITY_DN2416_c0_g1~~TRINITY_DN2416_c0_g1_i2.p1  ORF type:complete len:310 (-),score=117.97 TRINITY_DN2416_c0_g1_i2:159-1088(-)
MTSVLRGERVLKMKGSSDRPQIIIIPPGLLKAATSSSMPLKIAKISPREPLSTPSLSSSPGPSSPLTDALNPVRKRANLDHLSTEEKLLRRKLKNRVAAQNARDKKRVKMDEMEDEIALLRKRNASLEQENLRLRELQSRLTPSSTFCLPLSPVSSSSEEEELSIITLETPSLPETNPSLPAERTGDDSGCESPTHDDDESDGSHFTEQFKQEEEEDSSPFSPASGSSSPLLPTKLEEKDEETPWEQQEQTLLAGAKAQVMETEDLESFIASHLEVQDPFKSFGPPELQSMDTSADWEQSYNELFPDLI